MLLRLKAWIVRRRFERATARYDRGIAQARAKHGRVRDAERAKAEAVHAALERAVDAEAAWR